MNVRQMQKVIERINRDKGWYDVERTVGDLVSLIHSEVSEALEAFRKSPEETMQEDIGEELADIIIRTLDMASRLGVDMQVVLERKIEKNRHRGYRHGGRRL